MELRNIMTAKPRSIGPKASLQDAVAAMDEAHIRHLPVVSEAGRLIGILSDRDLLEATGWLAEPSAGAEAQARPFHVDEVMQGHVVTASPYDTVVTAAVDLIGRKIGCLPVVEDELLVGILSEIDIVGAYLELMKGRYDAGDNPLVEQLMASPPVTVEMDSTLSAARRIMRVDDMRHLPVMAEGALVGMLSDRDLRRAHGEGRSRETPVSEVMSREVRSLATGARASDVAAALVHGSISAVPVVDEHAGGKSLVGIVTVTDLLDHCLESLRQDDPMTSPG